jgi:hypothetical protein
MADRVSSEYVDRCLRTLTHTTRSAPGTPAPFAAVPQVALESAFAARNRRVAESGIPALEEQVDVTLDNDRDRLAERCPSRFPLRIVLAGVAL